MPSSALASSSPSFLRAVLWVDAAASLAMGLLLDFGAAALAAPLGLPTALLQGAGLALLPFAALLAWLASRAEPPRGAVWPVVACNAVWVLESLWLAAGDWAAPTALGQAFLLAQAGAVAVLAALEATALRRRSARHQALV